MADNIKIVGEILSTQEVSRYDDTDVRLLTSQRIQEDFGQKEDYIEYFIYDAGGNLLNLSYNYKDFKLPNTSFVNTDGFLPIIEIDPVKDLQNVGYSSGEFKVQYNFFNNKVSNPSAELFLKEISSDRTEIRVGSTILTNSQIESASLALINEYTGSAYFTDYIINFGNNNQALAVNVALNKVESGYEILFKLYNPLPSNITEKSNLWVVKEKINPFVFDVNLDKLIVPPPPPQLKGPNFDIDIPNQNNVATSYQSYTGLINSVQNVSTASYQQLLSLITSQSININVDYTDYNNFVFFSSAEQRIKNFFDKVKQIEDYQNNIAKYTVSSSLFPNMINDKNTATASINDIITNFDGYEYYLYFESSSYTWPKSNITLPYILASTASAFSWYNTTTGSAIDYDNNNQNNLTYTLPSFIIDDTNNNQYITFINMVGHYFDNIWIFLQAVTDINLANNNLGQGVSKDLVYHVLQSLGINLYNQYGDTDNVAFLIGNSGSAYYTGSDDQAFTYTGSYLNTIPKKDLLAESYKRIYHNLPLLLKTKGTTYGLQTLISTFGITGSILNTKEYGGNVKPGLLDEFNNSKIRIVSNDIVTGSVLSPFISLQQQPTSSLLFRTNDSHYVDISFSPQEEIDQFTSSSISINNILNNTTWSIDNYIGDPRQQYSGSYTDLLVEKQTYYSPLTASIIPFTGSAGSGSIGATDYNSFIRLIQYFDNSLFKMIKDFIPARANLSTGITINSPLLERNKISLTNPSSTSKITTNEGSISGSTIGTQYTDLYAKLTGSRVAYYDGNLTGSSINVNSYFVSGNFNPFLLNFSSGLFDSYTYEDYVLLNYWFSTILQSYNINDFAHSEFNILLNNVSQSRFSSNRRDLEYIFGTTGSITYPAQLQDSYNTLKTHQLSRYDGVKLSSTKYNDYTDGDISYGRTAVIDKNSYKLGLFSEITPNKFLPKRNNAALKYLIDADGNFTELNQRNKHWQEVQNIFKSSYTGSISLFNNQQYSNQKATDGEKLIFDSGYTYNPILYFGTGSIDTKAYFENIEDPSSYLIVAQNSGSSYYITGSSSNLFPIQLSTGKMFNLFNKEISDSDNVFTPGNATATSASYTALDSGDYKLISSFDLSLAIPLGGSGSYTLKLLKNGVAFSPAIENTQDFPISNSATSSANPNQTLFSFQSTLDNYIVYATKPILMGGNNYVIGDPFLYWDEYFLTGSCNDLGGGANGRYSVPGVTANPPASCDPINPIYNEYVFSDYLYRIDDFNTPTGTVTKTVSINKPQSNPITLTKNDILTLEFSQSYVSVIGGGSNYTASITQGSLEIGSLATTTGYSFTSYPYFNSSSLSSSIAIGSGSNTITFNSALSNFNNAGYQFIPNPLSGSTSMLYSISASYGDVDYKFNINPYDMVVAQLSDNSYVESRILSSSISSSFLQIHLDSDMSSLFKNNIISGSYQRFLLLKKVEDETNVHLSFTKRDGKTSYGFLIPEDINQDVLNNIDTITKETKQKLLNESTTNNI